MRTLLLVDINNLISGGITPKFVTSIVSSVVPENMFVNIQAISSYNYGWSSLRSNSGNFSKIPELMTSIIGILITLAENIFRRV